MKEIALAPGDLKQTSQAENPLKEEYKWPPGSSWSQKGVDLYQAGKLSQAAKIFEEASRVSFDTSASLNAAVIYGELGQNEKVLALLEDTASRSANNPHIQAAFGRAALREKRYDKARGAFEKALSIHPNYEQAAIGLARLQWEMGISSQAIKTLESIIQASPENALAWIYLARIWEKEENWPKAIDAYKKAYVADDASLELRLSLGRIYQKLGNFNDAWRQHTLILNAEPYHREAQSRQKALAKLITEPPEKIIPPLALKEPRPVERAPDYDKHPVLRIGLGSDAGGDPLQLRAIVFRCTGPFEVIDPATGKSLKEGPANEKFLTRLNTQDFFEVSDANQARLLRFNSAIAIRPKDPAKDSLIFYNVRMAQGFSWSEVGDRQYKGKVEIRRQGRGLYLVNEISLEDYLYGVITHEMPSSFPLEALKAQAVIARTHALYIAKHHSHRHQGFDLCDGQHCQVYGGIPAETPRSRQVAQETQGQVLRFKGRLAQTPYASNCGGHTQDSGEVLGWADISYLKGKLDEEVASGGPRMPWQLDLWLKRKPQAYCNFGKDGQAARFRWVRVIPAKEIQEMASRISPIGEIQRILVVGRSKSGHAKEVWVEGKRGRVELNREHRIRKTLGFGSMRSTLFMVETERDEKGNPTEFIFYGAGWGHGVGLCQYGAAGRASKGQSYKQILEHYYDRAQLEKI